MIILFRILNALFIIWDIFYSVFLLGLLWKFIAKNIYRKELKNKCGSLGLEHVPSEYYNDFGHLTGTLNNYHVKVKFENYINNFGTYAETVSDTLITIKSQAPKYAKRLELKREKPLRKPDDGMEDFSANNFSFNHIFKTRRADSWIAKQFKEIAELSDKFAIFYLRWIFRLCDFNVEIVSDEQCFECRLNYGRPFTQYISLNNLGKIINELIDLIKFFDNNMQEKSK